MNLLWKGIGVVLNGLPGELYTIESKNKRLTLIKNIKQQP